VDRLCQQLLAGAGFAHDEDGNVASQHLVDLFDHHLELRIAGIQVVKAGQAARGIGRCAGLDGCSVAGNNNQASLVPPSPLVQR
jgi:hypothetical protein